MDITTPKQGTTNQKHEKPKWIVNLENNIERIRTEIAHVQVIKSCKDKGKFTKHQNTILHRLTKKYQNENTGDQTSIIKTRPEK